MQSKLLLTFVNIYMNTLFKHINQGEVYRRSDLEYYSTAIDRQLAQLIKGGQLVKLNQGLYYAPMQSKFGVVPPDDHLLIERFLKDEDFLLISPNVFNTLGLGLTQLYNTMWVYNHKRKGELTLNGKTFEFKIKNAFPQKVDREYLLVELLNNLESLAEDKTQIVDKLTKNVLSFNMNALMKVTQQFGNGTTKRIIKLIVRKVLQHA